MSCISVLSWGQTPEAVVITSPDTVKHEGKVKQLKTKIEQKA